VGVRPRLVLTHPAAHVALKTIAVLTVAAGAVAGCRAGSPTPSPPVTSPTPVNSPTPAVSPTVASVAAPVAFHVRLDANQTLSLRTPPADCPGLDAVVVLSAGQRILLSAYATSCESSDTDRPINGRHGTYRSTADIPADRRSAAVTFRTALGEATAFTQPYSEYTNSRHDYTEPVAVIMLDHPLDTAYQALVVCGDKGSISLEQLTTVLKTQLQP
jgi:hypothetical protein